MLIQYTMLMMVAYLILDYLSKGDYFICIIYLINKKIVDRKRNFDSIVI